MVVRERSAVNVFIFIAKQENAAEREGERGHADALTQVKDAIRNVKKTAAVQWMWVNSDVNVRITFYPFAGWCVCEGTDRDAREYLKVKHCFMSLLYTRVKLYFYSNTHILCTLWNTGVSGMCHTSLALISSLVHSSREDSVNAPILTMAARDTLCFQITWVTNDLQIVTLRWHFHSHFVEMVYSCTSVIYSTMDIWLTVSHIHSSTSTTIYMRYLIIKLTGIVGTFIQITLLYWKTGTPLNNRVPMFTGFRWSLLHSVNISLKRWKTSADGRLVLIMWVCLPCVCWERI